ncbi:hypothetical protein MTO96_030138 [Rhipicephalus appendiculatus]
MPPKPKNTQTWTADKRRLRPTAVPSQKLPKRSHDHEDLSRVQAAASRAARASARSRREVLPETRPSPVNDSAVSTLTTTTESTADAELFREGAGHGLPQGCLPIDTGLPFEGSSGLDLAPETSLHGTGSSGENLKVDNHSDSA